VSFVTGLLATLGGVVRVVRKQSPGMLKAAGWIGGSWVLLLLARPRLTGPTRESCRDGLRPQVEQLLNRAADLVLAICWSHPDRIGPSPNQQSVEVTLPESLSDALNALQTVFDDQISPGTHLRIAVRALLQRVREEGYEWQTLPPGTSYDANLAVRFESFDQIAVGQRVETLQPALIRHGECVKPGVIRSFEG
jgi:hypothetical protein